MRLLAFSLSCTTTASVLGAGTSERRCAWSKRANFAALEAPFIRVVGVYEVARKEIVPIYCGSHIILKL
jgi:hypothetical protein